MQNESPNVLNAEGVFRGKFTRNVPFSKISIVDVNISSASLSSTDSNGLGISSNCQNLSIDCSRLSLSWTGNDTE